METVCCHPSPRRKRGRETMCSFLFVRLAANLFASFSVLRSRGVGGACLAVNNEETGGVRWKRSELLNRKHLNKKTPFFVEKSLCELILRKTVFLLNL
jgi:hypothetical protein